MPARTKKGVATMLLKVGELARRSGLTVRTLHHYHDIGLLVPVARTDAGYRLYGRDDLARLHRIQALRRFGLSLGEIGELLARPALSLGSVIERQVRVLEQEIAHRTRLRERLVQLGEQLARGEEPELADWLTTMELMNMYDRYFTRQELQQLRFHQADAARQAQWRELVEAVRLAMAQGLPASSEEAQSLARRWMAMLEEDTGGNPRLLAKLDAMHAAEPDLRERTGITPEIRDYVLAAFNQTKLAIYRRWLDDEEFAFLSANYPVRMQEWPPLVAALREKLESGVPAASSEVQELARRWLELFRSYAGDDPRTQQKIREALAQEPELRQGSWVSDDLLAYLRQAMATLPASR